MRGWHFIADDLLEVERDAGRVSAWLSGAVDRGVAAVEKLHAKHGAFDTFLRKTGRA